jgi:hypothetical protein
MAAEACQAWRKSVDPQAAADWRNGRHAAVPNADYYYQPPPPNPAAPQARRSRSHFPKPTAASHRAVGVIQPGPSTRRIEETLARSRRGTGHEKRCAPGRPRTTRTLRAWRAPSWLLSGRAHPRRRHARRWPHPRRWHCNKRKNRRGGEGAVQKLSTIWVANFWLVQAAMVSCRCMRCECGTDLLVVH